MSMTARHYRGSWYVDFRFSRNRIRLKSPEDSKRGAEAYERLLRNKLMNGEAIDGTDSKDATFKDFAEEWFKSYVMVNNKRSEQVGKETTLRLHLYPFFGKYELQEITSKHIEQFKKKQHDKGLSPKSINNHLTTLSKLFHSAEEWGVIDKIPRIKRLKCPQKAVSFLDEEQCQTLLSDDTEPLFRDMVLAALNTGMRLGELRGLMWEDVDFKRSLITIKRSVVRNEVTTPKSHHARTVPMSSNLDSYLYSIKRKEGYVFERVENEYLSAKECVGGLWRLCRRAGMQKFGWHRLRHTFASHLVIKGVPLYHIQKLLGHSTITMTERYAHLAPQSLHDAVAVLDRSGASFGHYMGTEKKLVANIR